MAILVLLYFFLTASDMPEARCHVRDNRLVAGLVAALPVSALLILVWFYAGGQAL